MHLHYKSIMRLVILQMGLFFSLYLDFLKMLRIFFGKTMTLMLM